MEIEKEEALLAKETKQLEEMEKNAKRAEAERKRQMKNARRLKPVSYLLSCAITSLMHVSFTRNILSSGISTVHHNIKQDRPPLFLL